MWQNKYAELPDGMESKELEPYIEEFLAENDITKDYDKMFGELHELGDRQWHSYELMNPQLLERFDSWFRLKLCDDEFDFHYINAAIGVMGMFGLVQSFNELKNIRNNIQNENVIAIIDDVLKYGEKRIMDPYISFWDPTYRPRPACEITLNPYEPLLFYQIKKSRYTM